MKKAYITPEILTVNLSAQEMMAGSVNIPVNGGDTGSVDYSPSTAVGATLGTTLPTTRNTNPQDALISLAAP